jgi:2-amino-4-hydroxy-6-hydroxymethyldihydropteridine diphosphokinase
MTKVALGLGSNIGDRNNYILTAIRKIAENKLLADVVLSELLNNKAVLTKDAPKKWDKEFLNCVIVGHTTLPPIKLLKELKAIEKDLGRIDTKTWAPREIDIDILLYGDICLKTKDLIIPHPGLLHRKFALCLLTGVEPNWTYPAKGKFFQKPLCCIEEELYKYEYS